MNAKVIAGFLVVGALFAPSPHTLQTARPTARRRRWW